jgi:hypothetical protein
MRTPQRVAAAVALLLVAAAVVLALLLPLAIASDVARDAIQSAARTALARDVRYGELDLGLFPPLLVMRSVAVAADSAQAPPLLEAERVTLRLAELPLRTRTLRIEATVADGRIQLDDMTLRGPFEIAAELRGGLAAPRGRFDIDATDAEIRYAEMFTKPPGDSATVTGRIVTGSDGTPEVDDVHLKIRNFEAETR